MIDIHFSVSEKEYLEAQKLFMSTNKKLKWIRTALLIVLLLSFVLVVSSALISAQHFGEALQQLLPFFAVVLVLLACFSPFFQNRGFKKRFLKEKQNLTNAHLVLDDAGYHIDIPGVGSGVAEWTSMDGWLEGKQIIILPAGLLMRILPKAPLTAHQLDEARELLTEKLGPVGVLRKR